MLRLAYAIVGLAALCAAMPAAFSADKPCTGFAEHEPFVLKLDPAIVYVKDGDTISERKNCVGLRLSDADTPETTLAKCAAEKDLGFAAAARTTKLIRDAKELEFRYSGDYASWGRPAGELVANGTSVGGILRNEGLACPYPKEMENDWCVKPPKCNARPRGAK